MEAPQHRSSPRCRNDGRRSNIAAAGILAMLAAFAWCVWAEVSLCPTKNLLGIPCPGCGLTRAALAMVALNFRGMWAMHPLAPVLVPLFGWIVGRAVLVEVGLVARRSPDPISRFPAPVWIVLVTAVGLVWGARLAGYLGGHPDFGL